MIGKRAARVGILASAWLAAVPVFGAAGGWTVVGWNNLGMHCMDADFSVFAILPPYNTIHAQVMDPTGKPGDDSGVTVTYQAVADSDRLDQHDVGGEDQLLAVRAGALRRWRNRWRRTWDSPASPCRAPRTRRSR